MRKKYFNEITRYIKAAPWPYLTGFGSLVLATGLGVSGLSHWMEENLAKATLFGCWGGGWLVVALFALADGVSRQIGRASWRDRV